MRSADTHTLYYSAYASIADLLNSRFGVAGGGFVKHVFDYETDNLNISGSEISVVVASFTRVHDLPNFLKRFSVDFYLTLISLDPRAVERVAFDLLDLLASFPVGVYWHENGKLVKKGERRWGGYDREIVTLPSKNGYSLKQVRFTVDVFSENDRNFELMMSLDLEKAGD